jgi:large subunit ribosomal protein L1
MTHRGKKYVQAKGLVDIKKKYTLDEAIELLPKTSCTKFIPSVEVAIKTIADPKYSDQGIRWTVVLPHGTGKKIRIAVFTSEDKVEEIKKMGADVVGANDLLSKIEKGEMGFDVLITEPTLIRDLAKVAKILGPKWLMPSPKAGTVTTNMRETIDEIKKGRVEFKLDKTGNIHTIAGKLNLEPQKLKENIETLIKAVNAAKPAGIKWKLVKKLVVATTMGPSIQLEA